jgi:hypothetical protein
MTTQEKDLTFFSVTQEHKDTLVMLSETLFTTTAGAFKASVALALSKGLAPETFSNGLTQSTATTISDLVEFLEWYCETDTPVRLANGLGHAGVAYVKRELERGVDAKDIFFSTL